METSDMVYRCWFLASVISLTTFLHAAAQSASPRYPANLLAEKQQSYPRGVLGNFRDVILPNLSEDERAALKDVILEFPLRLEGREPMGFVSIGGNQKRILMSVQSLKFLDDMSTAFAWLNQNGFSLENAFNYLSMIRHWNRLDLPPLPLDALCIPDNVLEDQNVDARSQDFLRTAVFFIMLHELGHILHSHPGNALVPPSQSRANEMEADAFALRVMAKGGDLPTGVPNLFLTMSYLSKTAADQSAERVPENIRLMRTHLLSRERLSALARTFVSPAQSYRRSGMSSLQIAALASQIMFVTGAYEETQHLAVFIGPTTTPTDLDPMKIGQKVGRPCQGWQQQGVLSGHFAGSTVFGKTQFDLGAVFWRNGDRVTGRYSAGFGFASLEGTVSGNELTYNWTSGTDSKTEGLSFKTDPIADAGRTRKGAKAAR